MGETFGFKYDYGSIMHYSANAFSSTTQPSMRRKDGQQVFCFVLSLHFIFHIFFY